jgi:hypothetical protein
MNDIYKPELMHYTTEAGLLGIITENRLRLTRYDYMNDKNEFREGNKLLEKITQNLLKTELKLAGNALIKETQTWIQALSNIALKYHDFFLFSFTTLTKDKNRDEIKKNGLLSMWRGYSNNTTPPLCIVFNTEPLLDLLWKYYENENISIHGLNYATYSETDWINKYKKSYEYLTNPSTGIFNLAKRYSEGYSPSHEEHRTALNHISNLLALLKNYGFHEENEMRLTIGKAKSPHSNPKTHHYTRNNQKIPCIYLDFEKLPIERIIIGPGGDEETKAWLEEKLRVTGYSDVTVRLSEIPHR